MTTPKKYYNTIAESYDKLYEQEQKEKLAVLKRLISKYCKISADTKILDVGCGSGHSSDFPCSIVGIDVSSGLIKIAKKRFVADKKKRFLVGKAEQLPFDEKFDIVISLSALQNFTDLEKAISEMKRVAKQFIFLSFPNRITRFNELDAQLRKAIAKEKMKLLEIIPDKVDCFYAIATYIFQ